MRVHYVSVRYSVVLHITLKCRNNENENILNLTYVEKLEILNKIENGDKLVNLANKFGVGCVTIYHIRKNSKKITIV